MVKIGITPLMWSQNKYRCVYGVANDTLLIFCLSKISVYVAVFPGFWGISLSASIFLSLYSDIDHYCNVTRCISRLVEMSMAPCALIFKIRTTACAPNHQRSLFLLHLCKTMKLFATDIVNLIDKFYWAPPTAYCARVQHI